MTPKKNTPKAYNKEFSESFNKENLIKEALKRGEESSMKGLETITILSGFGLSILSFYIGDIEKAQFWITYCVFLTLFFRVGPK